MCQEPRDGEAPDEEEEEENTAADWWPDIGVVGHGTGWIEVLRQVLLQKHGVLALLRVVRGVGAQSVLGSPPEPSLELIEYAAGGAHRGAPGAAALPAVLLREPAVAQRLWHVLRAALRGRVQLGASAGPVQ